MSDIQIIVGFAGHAKPTRGFVPTKLRDVLEDFDYARAGALICNGKFIHATIPADKFDELKAAVAPSYTVVKKSGPAPSA